MQHSTTVVPAQPGFFTVDVITDERGTVVDVSLHPVLAWAVEHHREGLLLIPITLEGDEDKAPVVYPDGRVVKPYEATWPSVAAWLSEQSGAVA